MNESGWADTIRRAVSNHGTSLNELHRQCGVPVGVLSRFMRRERTLTLPTAEKLCDALGLHLAVKPVGRPSGSSGIRTAPGHMPRMGKPKPRVRKSAVRMPGMGRAKKG